MCQLAPESTQGIADHDVEVMVTLGLERKTRDEKGKIKDSMNKIRQAHVA